MGFTISYRTLFEVKLLHHFFLNRANELFDNMDLNGKAKSLKGYDVRDFVDIEPTAACARILSKYHFIYKNTPFGLIVGTRSTESAGKFFPAVEIDEDLQLTFKLKFNDPCFSNYTSLPLVQNAGCLYYFQNRVTGAKKKFPYLAQYAAVFDAAETYSSGDILGSAAVNPAKLFIAGKVTTSAPPHADWVEDTLVAGKPLQYVTKKDQVPVYGDVVRYNTGEAGLSITVTVKDRQGNVLTVKSETVTDNDKSVAMVDINPLPEGLYTIKLEDAGKPYSKEFSFYRLDKKSDADALIDICIKGDDLTYNIVAPDGSLNEPVFELRFRNRWTKWRYMGARFTNLPESGPHPLTQKGVVAVTVKDKDSTDIADMPNAGIQMMKTEHAPADNTHYEVISEIYIN